MLHPAVEVVFVAGEAVDEEVELAVVFELCEDGRFEELAGDFDGDDLALFDLQGVAKNLGNRLILYRMVKFRDFRESLRFSQKPEIFAKIRDFH